MSLTPGQTLSFYEIGELIGAGGMGEVYRARDTRLDRAVAIKVLPPAFADDEERLRRFEREAKVLASLNHPNIAQIYGVDHVDDTWFLALELVEGESLAQRLRRGPLEMDETLDVARQIAEGLEAAHDCGVIHRDLKPANVQLIPDGRVKVLDFGLAKAVRPADSARAEDSTLSTQAGRLLGTPTYMAPEQARGRSTDRRVDIWAFGCVLHECLTGSRAFGGETLPEVLGAVMHGQADDSRLPAGLPPGVRHLISRCLVKDPRKRLRDIGEARLVLESPDEPGPAPEQRATQSLKLWPWIGVAAAAGILLGSLGLRGGAARAPERPPLRFSIHAPRSGTHVFPRISPDGHTVIYEALLGEEDTRHALFLRDLGREQVRQLAGTEGAATFCFSPDGSAIAVLVADPLQDGGYRVLEIPLDTDGPSIDHGAWPRRFNTRSGMAWVESGKLVSSAIGNRLLVFPMGGDLVGDERVPYFVEITGGVENPAMTVDVYRDLLDSRHVLGRTYSYGQRGFVEHVVAVDVQTGAETVLVDNAAHGAYLEDGRLLFTRGDTLFEAPFDRRSLETTGAQRPIAGGLQTTNYWQSAWFDVSRDGVLIWNPTKGGQAGVHYLALVEADGTVSVLDAERRPHDAQIIAARDGSYFTSTLVSASGLLEVWGSEIDNPLLQPLLSSPGADYSHGFPVPGSNDIVFLRLGDDGANGIYRTSRSDRSKRELLIAVDDPSREREPVGISPDGTRILIRDVNLGEDVFRFLALDGSARLETEQLMAIDCGNNWPKFSPRSDWLAYLSREGVGSSVVVRRSGPGGIGPEVPVPVPEGLHARDLDWISNPSTGVQELVLLANDGRRIVAVPVLDGASVRFGESRIHATFASLYVEDLSALADGRMLVLVQDEEGRGFDRVEVLLGAQRR